VPSPFVDPPWDAPLDPRAALRRVPAAETIKGMFLQAMVGAASAKGQLLPGARDRYVPFQDYPLREHVDLLVESAKLLYPDMPLRQGLRRIGRHAPAALRESTIGRVLWSSAHDVHSMLSAMAKGYAVVHPSSAVTVFEEGPNRARVSLERIWWFLDSHHVGCFEGAMRAAGVATGTVKIRLSSFADGEMLCTW
jgi:uncharacterized protein (TIGR02265 family)